jgi:hypothetical protein
MKPKVESDSLSQAISLLQVKRAEELKLLKDEFYLLHDSLKPINLIKSTFHEITSTPDIKNNMVSTAIGLTTGYLSKKAIFGTSHNPIKKIVGLLLQFAITNIVSKNADGIKSTGENLFQRFLKNRRESKSEFHHNGSE